MSSHPSSRPSLPIEIADGRFLQPPPGRRYVRSFLFSRRIDAPLGWVHLLARTLLIFCLSAALLSTMNTRPLDIVGVTLLGGIAGLLFALSGLHWRLARLQLLLIIPSLYMFFLAWIVFTPITGPGLFSWSLYSGRLTLGLAPWQAVWLLVAGGYFWWRRGIVNALLLATLVAIVFALLVPLPGWAFTQTAFFRPLAIVVSGKSIILALTKMIAYGGMILCTLALIISSRDTEFIGAMHQLRIPQPVIFFLSTVTRALNLALVDYETIYQAQIARAVDARPRSFWKRLRDLASIAVPMVAVMIRRSSEIGDALVARGYRLGGRQADFYETSPWRLLDWGVVILALILLCVAFGWGPDLTSILFHL